MKSIVGPVVTERLCLPNIADYHTNVVLACKHTSCLVTKVFQVLGVCNICVRVSPFDTVISFFKTIITPELVMMRYKQCHFHHKKFVDMDILKKGDLFSKKIVKQDLETIKNHL